MQSQDQRKEGIATTNAFILIATTAESLTFAALNDLDSFAEAFLRAADHMAYSSY